jgi:Xaa-Pro aminopeptidase
MDVSGRLSRINSVDGAEFVLVLRLEDIRWLTGFTGGTAQLLVRRGTHEAWLLVDGRYFDRATDEISESNASVHIERVVPDISTDEMIARIVGALTVAVDPTHVTAHFMTVLQSHCTVLAEKTQLDDLRRVKDDAEISLIASAATISDIALSTVVADGLMGRTEKQIRNHLDHLMREGGADDVAFETIVATGPLGARPHHEPSDAIVEDGHGVVIDFGAMVQGYKSDMTRTIRVGAVSAEYQRMFDLVLEAESAGIASVKAGVVGAAVDAAARAVFLREGVDHEYVHGTGHGIGLYIHEQPILSPRCTAVLGINEVVTVEPGLYRGGVGGVRIEDLVVVTGDSCRILTHTPKDLTCPRSPRTI